MFDLPPILSGSSSDKLAALRNYLVRLAQELNNLENQAVEQTVSVSSDGKRGFSTGETASKDIEAVRKNAASLRQLIIKTGDRLSGDIQKSEQSSMHYADGQIDALSQTYLAKSEFGSFTENIESQIASTAKGVVESYDYESRIISNQESLELLQYYVSSMDGQIRRGIVTDPETGLEVTGIAISQNLQFTGAVVKGEDGADYYQLSSGQTFGLYTSTGWQFWINGWKKGWYDSVDGMLHIANVAVENALQLGGQWQLVNSDGLGIKYTGG
ncbi:MAG: hypothetical protein IJB09_04625 [Oscillospiraceae bacterium]|nr:hypothetical protein [Oscillospiraceae bacterium]